MADEKWRKVREIFDSAMRRKPEERREFVIEACGEDEELLSEVESLLLSLDGAESFMEAPAVASVAAAFSGDGNKLEKGQLLGHYEIIGQLGSGGMGEVYLAKDQKLDRHVAIKVLNEKFSDDESNLNRFVREARAASALNHPNILVIHEIGETEGAHYIVSEYVEGETLRTTCHEKPLGLSDVLDIAIQVAGALATAHKAHLIHRDIKPENIMVRPDGYVKILDFGLAKLVEKENKSFLNLEDPTAMQNQTAKGVILGTVNYMSPEQAKGERVDERTDIFSFGTVVYEMITGNTPFAGDSMSETFANLINAQPQPLSRLAANVPDELQRIVSKTLRKKKDERYQTMKDLLTDLKDLRDNLTLDEKLDRSASPDVQATASLRATTGDANMQTAETQHGFSGIIKQHKPLAAFTFIFLLAGSIGLGYFLYARKTALGAGDGKSIAVLPFVNVSGDSGTEYLSYGISDSIINSLSRLPNMKVISLNSVLRYKGKEVDPQAVGRELNVGAVLMGRMTPQGDDLAISIELVDVNDNRRLWGEQYNRKLSDIIAVPTEIAQQISEKLRLGLNSEEKKQLAKHDTEDTEAYRLYSLGLQSMNPYTKEALEKAIEYFEAATKADPKYALAFDGLWRAYYGLGQRAYWLPKETRQKMEWAALKAVELDDTSIQAHIALATSRKVNWDWAGAEKEYQRAVELDPNAFGPNFSANFSYASFLMDVGRLDEAMVYAKKAEEVDQKSAPVVAWVYLYKGEYDKALELYLKNSRGSGFQLTQAYLGKGMYTEGIAELQKSIASNPAPEAWGGYPMLAYAYGKAGRRDEALNILGEQQKLAKQSHISPFNFAIMYTGLDDKDRAFEYLNKACEEHVLQLSHFAYGPLFESLHLDPRYKEFLRCVGLK